MDQAEDAKNFFFAGVEAFSKKQFEHAETLFLESLSRVPDRVSVLTNLSAAQIRLAKYEPALATAKRVISLDPKNVEGFLNAGVASLQLSNKSEALAYFDRAAEIDASRLEIWFNRGVVKKELGYFSEAESDLKRVLSVDPKHVEALSNLGGLLWSGGRFDEAESVLRLAISLKPVYAEAYALLGRNLHSQGFFDEAQQVLRRAIELKPDLASAYNFRGLVLSDFGEVSGAIENFLKAVELQPTFHEAHSNALFGYNYLSDSVGSSYAEEARRFGEITSRRTQPKFTDWNIRNSANPIRVGFVSGDLREHVVGYFIDGLIRNFDKQKFELFAFPTTYQSDHMTERMKPFFKKWLPLFGENDFDAARLIHDEGINILLDLSGHTASNRLPVFSFKPAPVQATWLGYFASTGLPEMDYFIADPQLSPPDHQDNFVEEIWNLPETWFCFSPPERPVEIRSAPVQSNGFITFANFSNLSKVNHDVIDAWSKVMKRVPNAKLFLKSKQLGVPAVAKSLEKKFQERGVMSDRLIFEGPSDREDYFEAYNKVDMILDTFPYPGGTTSCEALWMGVPVLTLRGNSFLSRIGFSINTNAALLDWVAEDVEDYVASAVMHSSDQGKLINLRSNLRDRVLSSPLFDQFAFARHFEQMITDMCKKSGV
jgi:protein O-GlcNAc transferase